MSSPSEAIERVHDAWMLHERANTPARVLALCSDRIRWIPPDGPEIQGKAAIADWIRRTPMTIHQLETSQREIWITGRLASLRASFEVRGVDAGGTAHTSRGWHHWVLEAEPDGQWRVVVVSWVVGPGVA